MWRAKTEIRKGSESWTLPNDRKQGRFQRKGIPIQACEIRGTRRLQRLLLGGWGVTLPSWSVGYGSQWKHQKTRLSCSLVTLFKKKKLGTRRLKTCVTYVTVSCTQEWRSLLFPLLYCFHHLKTMPDPGDSSKGPDSWLHVVQVSLWGAHNSTLALNTASPGQTEHWNIRFTQLSKQSQGVVPLTVWVSPPTINIINNMEGPRMWLNW